MVMKYYGRKKRFDEDADWVPSKGRLFTLKTGHTQQDEPYHLPLWNPKVGRDLSFALKGPKLSNAELMEKAYEAPGSIYIYGDTRAIAGTKGLPFLSKDWMQNFKYLGIPWITGEKVETEKTDRFQDNERARAAAPYTKKTIGHSLGGSVAIAERQKYGDATGTMYSTPYPLRQGNSLRFFRPVEGGAERLLQRL